MPAKGLVNSHHHHQSCIQAVWLPQAVWRHQNEQLDPVGTWAIKKQTVMSRGYNSQHIYTIYIYIYILKYGHTHVAPCVRLTTPTPNTLTFHRQAICLPVTIRFCPLGFPRHTLGRHQAISAEHLRRRMRNARKHEATG